MKSMARKCSICKALQSSGIGRGKLSALDWRASKDNSYLLLEYISAVNCAIHILQMPSRTLQTLSHFFRTTATRRPLLIPLSRKLYTTTRSASSAVSKRLEGKTVLITGASSGIGRSTAKEFARSSPKNLRLILTARRLEKLHELAQEIREEVGEGVKVHTVKLDVSQPEEVSRLVDGLPEEFRSVDILVNNAYELLLSPCLQCS